MKYNDLEIKIKKIDISEQELVEIHCHAVDSRVRDIVTFVKSRQGQLSAGLDGKQYEVPITEVYYIEAVDNKVFIYCAKQVYETKQKLYELEEILVQKRFLRISKSILLNLMKVQALKPALNGRFSAILPGGEEIIISRKYVSNLKKTLKGEAE